MTQNGQGDEPQLPAVRRAHEGVVLPSDGSGPWVPEVAGEHTVPAGGQPWGQPWGPQDAQALPPQQIPAQQPQSQPYMQSPHQPQALSQPHQPQALPQAQQPQQHLPQPQQHLPQQPQQPQQHLPYQAPQAPQAPQAQPMPQMQHPMHPQAQPQSPSYAQPLPPEAVPGMGMGLGLGDSDATQFIAPISVPPESPAESTQFLGHHPQPGAAPGSDADATQFLPPVPAAPAAAPYDIRPGAPEDRVPPAEFDSLFRSDAASGPQAAGETQQLPVFDAQQPYGNDRPGNGPAGNGPGNGRGNAPYGNGAYGQQPPPPPQQQYAPQPPPPGSRAAAGADRRRSSRVPLIAAAVVGIAVVGLGVGALLSGGGSDTKDDKQPAASTETAASKPAQAAEDPAKAQAVALDKLLADSNSSRSAVIAAVAHINSCQNLDQAEQDLSGAAKQRHSLVTRLGALSVDQLPDHAQLTSSLTTAWNASATADEQYAAWARNVADKGKKGCKHGRAKRTEAAGRGDAASGQATAAKKQASGLWNTIAEKYSLTTRRVDQL
ncbi:hypothetical protein [Streptomyces sp. A 4/2]|uniref:hypothetical protein n=1 Tax=Streptomyces sp. A 4/2 TaxID=2934314 RepID=UPI0020253FD2|nr:hypothetical protein [Streptomyces sp. A 4/2]